MTMMIQRNKESDHDSPSIRKCFHVDPSGGWIICRRRRSFLVYITITSIEPVCDPGCRRFVFPLIHRDQNDGWTRGLKRRMSASAVSSAQWVRQIYFFCELSLLNTSRYRLITSDVHRLWKIAVFFFLTYTANRKILLHRRPAKKK